MSICGRPHRSRSNRMWVWNLGREPGGRSLTWIWKRRLLSPPLLEDGGVVARTTTSRRPATKEVSSFELGDSLAQTAPEVCTSTTGQGHGLPGRRERPQSLMDGQAAGRQSAGGLTRAGAAEPVNQITAFAQFCLNWGFARGIMNSVMPVHILHSISLLSQHIEPSNPYLISRNILFLIFVG